MWCRDKVEKLGDEKELFELKRRLDHDIYILGLVHHAAVKKCPQVSSVKNAVVKRRTGNISSLNADSWNEIFKLELHLAKLTNVSKLFDEPIAVT